MDACNFILGGPAMMAHDVPAWRVYDKTFYPA